MNGVILQPNYIPWKGYFDLINRADIFVFYDDVKYTKRDWRNRNKIKTQHGVKWITIPVINKGKFDQLIKDVIMDENSGWREKHWDQLRHNYAKTKYYQMYCDKIKKMYDNKISNLCDFNIAFTLLISEILGIKTKCIRSSDLNTNGSQSEKLIQICKKLEITHYLSGPSAADYIDDNKFKREKIEVTYHEYLYTTYHQLYGDFEHNVTILDLIFNCGEESSKYIWGENSND